MCRLKKKSRLLIITVISSMLIIGACSNQNIVKKSSEEGDETKESLGSTYGFSFIDLTADTKEMKIALKAIYEEKRDKTEAMYENKIEDLYLHGDEAMEKLASIFEELEFEPDMADEDMIKKASEAFEIMDYESLKLTIKFKGHDTKELMMTK